MPPRACGCGGGRSKQFALACIASSRVRVRRSLSVSDTCPNLTRSLTAQPQMVASYRPHPRSLVVCGGANAFAEFCKSILSIYRAREGERHFCSTEFCETSVQESTVPRRGGWSPPSRGVSQLTAPAPSGAGEEREARAGSGGCTPRHHIVVLGGRGRAVFCFVRILTKQARRSTLRKSSPT